MLALALAHSRALALALVLALLLIGGCADSARGPVRPNVLLITVDTLRVDRLGCYGAERATPHFDRLAADGALFENAITTMPVTRPSHLALLTSRYPRDLGLLSNADILADGEGTTVTEIFAEAGYRTAAFTGVKLLARGSGADRGFEDFGSPEKGRQSIATDVVDSTLEWLKSYSEDQARAAPFFLWVHVYDPHMAYEPPEPFAEPPHPLLAERRFSRPDLNDLLAERDGDLPEELLDYAKRLYTGEVAYVDHSLGRILTALEEDQALDRTIVAVTADHGECFSHGIYFEHGGCLYDGALRVPLLLRYPPAVAAGERVTEQVDLLDVAPTLLELAELPVPEEYLGGSLARPEVDGITFAQHPIYTADAIERRNNRRLTLRSVGGEPLRAAAEGEILALRTNRWKYIVGPDREELYDLAADPEEVENLADDRPEVVADLRRDLRLWRRDHPMKLQEDRVVDEETRKTLESLGY